MKIKLSKIVLSIVVGVLGISARAEINGELMKAETAADWTTIANYSDGWGGSGTATSLPSNYLLLNKAGTYKITVTDNEAWEYFNSVNVILMHSDRVLEITVPAGVTAEMDVRISAFSDDWTPNTGKIRKLGAGTLILTHAAGDRFTANRTYVPGLPKNSVAANYLINMEIAEGTVKLPAAGDCIYVGGVTVKSGAEFYLLGNPSGAAKTIFNYLIVEQGGTLVSTAANSTFDILPWMVSPTSKESSFVGTFKAETGRFNIPTTDLNAGNIKSFDYYRLTITEYNHTSGGQIELREVALFDEDGKQVNAGLKIAAGYAKEARQPFNDARWYFYTVASDPAPGEYAFSPLMSGQNLIISGDSESSTLDDAMAKNFDVIFDGNIDTIGIHGHLWSQPVTTKDPLVIVMHLPENSKPVKAFDICSAYSNFTGPKRVKLEGSIDNENWTTVYSNFEEAKGWPTAPGRGVWYSDGGSAWQEGWSFAIGGAHEAEINACLTSSPKSGGFSISTSGVVVEGKGVVSSVGAVAANAGAEIGVSGARVSAGAVGVYRVGSGTISGVNFANGAAYNLEGFGNGRSASYAIPNFVECEIAGISAYWVEGAEISGWTVEQKGGMINLSRGEWVFTLKHGEKSEDWLKAENYMRGWGAGEVSELLPAAWDRIIFEWNTTYALDASNKELIAMFNQPITLMFQPGSVVEFFVPEGMTIELDSRLWGYYDGITPNCGRLVKTGKGTLLLTHANGDVSVASKSEVPGLPREKVSAHYNINMEVAEGTIKLPAEGDMIYVGGVTIKGGAEFYLMGNPSGAAKTIFNYLVVEEGGVLASTAKEASFDVLPWTLKHPGVETAIKGIVRADEGKLDLTAGCGDSFKNFEYYRYTVCGYDYNTEKRMYIREIALFDENGVQVNAGITLDENSYEFVSHDGWADRYTILDVGLPAKGKFCFGLIGATYYSITKDDGGNFISFDYVPNRFFDGKDTDANFYNHQCKLFEEVPLSIIMHLPEGAKPATMFDVASGWTAEEEITRSTLEGSPDGVHWTTIYSNAAPGDEVWPNNPGIGVWMSDLTSCIGAGHWVSKRFPLAATGGVKLNSVGLVAAKEGAQITSAYPVTANGCMLMPGVNGTISGVVFSASAHWDFLINDERVLETRYELPNLDSAIGESYLDGDNWFVNSQAPDDSFEMIKHLPGYFSLFHYLRGSMMIFR